MNHQHLQSRVQIPSTTCMLSSIYIVVQIMYLSFQLECGKNGNKQKEARIGPLKNTSRGKCGTEIPPQVFQELKYNIIICLTLRWCVKRSYQVPQHWSLYFPCWTTMRWEATKAGLRPAELMMTSTTSFHSCVQSEKSYLKSALMGFCF